VNIFNQHHAFSPHLIPPFFNIAYYSVLLADFELEYKNDPEFVEDLKTQNATAATFKYIEERLMAEIDNGFEMLMKEVALVIEKTKNDAAVGLYSNKSEKQQPPATAAKKTRGKRTQRSPLIKKTNTSPGTVVQATRTYGKTLVDITGTTPNEVIPKGKVRVEVFSKPNIRDERSPHEGLVCLLEPLQNIKARKARCCKIGRSIAMECKNFGVSLYNDDQVSTNHAVLTQVVNKYYIEDMGSSNGTLDVASGAKIQPLVPIKLEDGILLQMGQCILKFNFSAL
jgi:hypothetical protein